VQLAGDRTQRVQHVFAHAPVLFLQALHQQRDDPLVRVRRKSVGDRHQQRPGAVFDDGGEGDNAFLAAHFHQTAGGFDLHPQVLVGDPFHQRFFRVGEVGFRNRVAGIGGVGQNGVRAGELRTHLGDVVAFGRFENGDDLLHLQRHVHHRLVQEFGAAHAGDVVGGLLDVGVPDVRDARVGGGGDGGGGDIRDGAFVHCRRPSLTAFM